MPTEIYARTKKRFITEKTKEKMSIHDKMKKTIIAILLVILLGSNLFALRLPYVPPERWIIIDDRITGFGAIDVITKIIELDQEGGDIRIYFYSSGGEVKAGLVIIDAIKTAKNDVQAVGIGMVSSMAAYIFASCTKGKRTLFEHGEIYTHRIIFLGMEDLTEKEEIELKSMQLILDSILIKNSKMKSKDIEEWRGKIMTATEAVKLGISDGIYEGEEDKK